MDTLCPLPSNTIVAHNVSGNGTNLLFKDFELSRLHMGTCMNSPTYLRPDPGGSLLPWPYAMAWLLIHLPVSVLRVTRWENVQILSIILAFFSVYFTMQAFTTHLRASQVMVWMPLTIVLDIGAMMQLVFLIVGENGVSLLWSALKESIRRVLHRDQNRVYETSGASVENPDGTKSSPVRVLALGPEPVPADCGLIGQAWVTILALFLLVVLLGHQLIGLVEAAKGCQEDGLKANWCSPMFTTAEAAYTSTECDEPLYHTDKVPSQGVGCISVDAVDQYHWLKATVGVLSVSLVFEVFDAAILIMASKNTKWWRVTIKRPWFTMFLGNSVLIFMVIISACSSMQLPDGVSTTVWVFSVEPSTKAPAVCQGVLHSAGVRGSIIGWTDGFLGSWKKAYMGG